MIDGPEGVDDDVVGGGTEGFEVDIVGEIGGEQWFGILGAGGIGSVVGGSGINEGDLLWLAAGKGEFDAVIDEPEVVGGICLDEEFLECRDVGVAAGEQSFNGGWLVGRDANGDGGFFGWSASVSVCEVQCEVFGFGWYEGDFEDGGVSGGGCGDERRA